LRIFALMPIASADGVMFRPPRERSEERIFTRSTEDTWNRMARVDLALSEQ
jgi:hypothetical protein